MTENAPMLEAQPVVLIPCRNWSLLPQRDAAGRQGWRLRSACMIQRLRLNLSKMPNLSQMPDGTRVKVILMVIAHLSYFLAPPKPECFQSSSYLPGASLKCRHKPLDLGWIMHVEGQDYSLVLYRLLERHYISSRSSNASTHKMHSFVPIRFFSWSFW